MIIRSGRSAGVLMTVTASGPSDRPGQSDAAGKGTAGVLMAVSAFSGSGRKKPLFAMTFTVQNFRNQDGGAVSAITSRGAAAVIIAEKTLAAA